MTLNIRKQAYDNILHQPIEYFDRKENSTGVLINTLSADMKAINGASIENYVYIFQAFVGLLFCIVVAFYFNTTMGITVL